jgi:hypothetical protein
MELTMGYILFSFALTMLNVGAIAWVMLHYVPRRMRTFAERQEKWHEIEDACNALIATSTVERCLVLKLTNGGSEPRPGGTYYVTAMVSANEDIKKHKAVDYNKLEVDDAYVDMVVGLKKTKRVQFLVETMQFSLLRDIYKDEGIKFAEVHYLASTNDATYFCSFAAYSDIHLQPSWGAMLRTVSDIRRMLREAYPGAK